MQDHSSMHALKGDRQGSFTPSTSLDPAVVAPASAGAGHRASTAAGSWHLLRETTFLSAVMFFHYLCLPAVRERAGTAAAGSARQLRHGGSEGAAAPAAPPSPPRLGINAASRGELWRRSFRSIGGKRRGPTARPDPAAAEERGEPAPGAAPRPATAERAPLARPVPPGAP